MDSLRYLVFALCGVDVRKFGSGNIGATNVFRVLGPIAVFVLVLDVGKGLVSAYLGALLFPDAPLLQVLAGVSAVVGHNWSVFLGFRGGKGVATTAGALLWLMPVLLGIGVGVFLLVVALTRYVSLGSILFAVWLALGTLMIPLPTAFRWSAWVVAVFIVYQHRSNIRRLLAGTESRFGEHVDPTKESREAGSQ